MMDPPPEHRPASHHPRCDAALSQEDLAPSRRRAALAYLYRRINYERLPGSVPQRSSDDPPSTAPFRLRRMRQLLQRLGHPQRHCPVIHIGGTKGKGSTATMVADMLRCSGYTVGLYTSPHLEHLEERLAVNGLPCSAAELVALVDRMRPVARALRREGAGEPTFFELTTAMAWEHFRNRRCDFAVVEVGLGGRLDSTNVCQPLVTAITSIGLDHQHLLGSDVAQIAAEKAGILKEGIPCISGVAGGPAAEVIQATAGRVGAPLRVRNRDFRAQPSPGPLPPWGSQFDYFPNTPVAASLGVTRRNWTLNLEGAHQVQNAAVALAIVDQVAAAGFPVDSEAQQQALATTTAAGRLERFPGPPETILDTAHNADSVEALCEVLRQRHGGRRTVVVFGTSADKDAEGMLRSLSPCIDEGILTRYRNNPRWRDPEQLAALAAPFRGRRGPAPWRVVDHAAEALQVARQQAGPDGWVILCGSFFLAAELRPLLAPSPQGPSPSAVPVTATPAAPQ